jgi:hypothetical protein
MVKNYYPEVPEIPYERTIIEMPDVAVFARSLVGKYSKDAVRMAYAIFRNESANGTRGVNNNYAGIQADNARWSKLPGEPIGTCVKVDSGKVSRRFLCFSKEDGYKICFELLCIKATDRNMYTAHDYIQKWVGKENPQATEVNWFNILLSQSSKTIP